MKCFKSIYIGAILQVVFYSFEIVLIYINLKKLREYSISDVFSVRLVLQ